jgi:hypothetical protein
MKAACAFGVALVLAVGLRAESPIDKLPEEIRQSEQTLTKWLKGFKDQTPEQVQKALGKPTEQTTWPLDGRKELLLKYQLTEGTQVSFYFHQKKVVKVSLHLLPE